MRAQDSPQGASAPFFVAVHVGAGFHSERKHAAYKAVMRRACKRAAEVLSQGGSAEDAVVQAIKALEVRLSGTRLGFL